MFLFGWNFFILSSAYKYVCMYLSGMVDGVVGLLSGSRSFIFFLPFRILCMKRSCVTYFHKHHSILRHRVENMFFKIHWSTMASFSLCFRLPSTRLFFIFIFLFFFFALFQHFIFEFPFEMLFFLETFFSFILSSFLSYESNGSIRFEFFSFLLFCFILLKSFFIKCSPSSLFPTGFPLLLLS